MQDTCRHTALAPYPGYWLPAYQIRDNWTWPSLPLSISQVWITVSLYPLLFSEAELGHGEKKNTAKSMHLFMTLANFTHPPRVITARLSCCWVGNFWAQLSPLQILPCDCNSHRTGPWSHVFGLPLIPPSMRGLQGRSEELPQCILTHYNNTGWLGLTSSLCSSER